MAAGNKVSLSAFAGRPNKRYPDDDLDEILGDDWSQKETKTEPQEEDFARAFEEAFDIDEWNEENHELEIGYGESAFEGPLETPKTLDSALTEEVLSQEEEEDDYHEFRVYDDIKEDVTTDDESTDAYSDISSEDKAAMRAGFQSEFTCVDKETIQKITLLANQTGANLNELQKFLIDELEVNGLVEEIGELKHEMKVKGLEKMEKVDWKALVSFVLPKGPIDQKKQLESGTLAIENGKESAEQKDCAEQEDGAEQKYVLEQTPSSTSDKDGFPLPNPPSWCSSTMNDFAEFTDFTMEEGMEIPYVSCDGGSNGKEKDSNGKESDSNGIETAEKKKRPSLLAKLIDLKYSKNDDASEPVAHEAVAVPALKQVLRLRLKDGSMATVSMESAAKLTNCNWV